MSKQYLLIGASAASFGALHCLRRLDPQAQITVIAAESEWPYNKCLLADYLAGSIDQTALSIYQNPSENVNLIMGQRVVTIDVLNKCVVTDSGNSICYDVLFLGMGSSPWIPPIPGIESHGVFTFHTNADVNALLDSIKKHAAKKVTVIGAGLSGLEAADALAKHELEVTIVERNKQVLPWMLTESAAKFLHDTINQSGTHLILNAMVNEVLVSDGCVKGVIVNGQTIETDVLIVATGLRPNTQLCRAATIALDDHGVIVNEYMQTSIADIYAGGDLVGVYDQLTGKKLRSCLWPDAMQQGMHAGMAMAGKPKAYGGISLISSTAFFGLKYARAGKIEMADALMKKSDNFHHTFLLKDGVLTAFEVLGNEHNLGALRRKLLTKQPVHFDEL